MEPFKNSPVSKQASGMNYKEIKSHSSLLSNERLAILFYMQDLNMINLNTNYDPNSLMKSKACLYQIYKNIRAIVRNNSQVRSTLNLETKDPGVYTIDVAFDLVEKMILYCNFKGYTYMKCYIITQHLNQIEIMIRDVLQFFHYFFRPEFKQKPDVLQATEKYKEMADQFTLEQLKAVVGKSNKIDFEHLGKRIDDNSEIERVNELNEIENSDYQDIEEDQTDQQDVEEG